MSIQTATRIVLEARRNQLEEEKKAIEVVIEKHRVIEQRAMDGGDGRTSIASRKTVEAQQELLEKLVIEENAVNKRLQEATLCERRAILREA